MLWFYRTNRLKYEGKFVDMWYPMKITVVILSVILFCFPVFAQSEDSKMKEWIDASSYRDIGIVVPENASPILQHSAEVFKKYWEMCTYRPITISTINQGIINIWLGRELCTQEWITPEELDELGDEGFIIRTYTPARKYAQKGVAKQLLICGKTDVGTLNGVFSFFERYLNVVWLSASYIHTPALGYRLKEIDYKFTPHFGYRIFISDLPEFKMEGDRKEGLHLSLSVSEKDFIPIPIYKVFLIEETQQNTSMLETSISNRPICFTSETAQQTFLTYMKKEIELQPERKFWTIDAGETENMCACPNCQELVRNNRAPVSPLLVMLNNAVSELEMFYPGREFYICLSLRGKMRQATSHMQVHNKIFIALSTDTCDVAHALEDPTSPMNACFINDLKAWRNLTPNILIQYYAGANYFCGLFPQPEWFHYQKNIQLFDRYQVQGIIVCAPSLKLPSFTEWNALKSYLLARLIWDPDLIIEDEINRFTNAYYGSAGSKFVEYFNYQREFVKNNNIQCSIYQKVPWWNTSYASSAGKFVEQTINMPFYSQDIYNHVFKTALSLYYPSLVSLPDIQVQEDKITEVRPDTIKEDQFWNTLEKVEGLVPRGSYSLYRDTFSEILCSAKFPERTYSYPFTPLENDFYKLWISKDKQGSIIRMQDKINGIEYLPAFQRGINSYSEWNEYQAISDTGCGIPFTGENLLKESDTNKVVTEREIRTGVFLRRKVVIGAVPQVLIEYECENKNSKEEKFSFYIIPRFNLPADVRVVEIWGNCNSKWKKLIQKEIASQPFSYTPEGMSKEETTGVGIFLCDKGIFLQMDFQNLSADSIDFLLDYSYYDGYISPIMKISMSIPSLQSIACNLLIQSQNKISVL